MSETPDDVMQAAENCENQILIGDIHDPSYDPRIIIARAIMAERERIGSLLKDPSAVLLNYLRGDIASQEIIKDALKLERERCARVAEAKMMLALKKKPDAEDHLDNRDVDIIQQVADAIRRTPKRRRPYYTITEDC